MRIEILKRLKFIIFAFEKIDLIINDKIFSRFDKFHNNFIDLIDSSSIIEISFQYFHSCLFVANLKFFNNLKIFNNF